MVTMQSLRVLFSCAAWNGDLLILGGEGGGVHIWDAATLSEITSAQEHTGKWVFT